MQSDGLKHAATLSAHSTLYCTSAEKHDEEVHASLAYHSSSEELAGSGSHVCYEIEYKAVFAGRWVLACGEVLQQWTPIQEDFLREHISQHRCDL